MDWHKNKTNGEKPKRNKLCSELVLCYCRDDTYELLHWDGKDWLVSNETFRITFPDKDVVAWTYIDKYEG